MELRRAADQAHPEYQIDLARALVDLGTTLRRLKDFQEAVIVIGEAIKLYRTLVERGPGGVRENLADTLILWSGLLLDMGRLEDAEAARREADRYGAQGAV